MVFTATVCQVYVSGSVGTEVVVVQIPIGQILQRLWLFYLAPLQLNQTFLRTKPCFWYVPGGLLVRLFKEFLAQHVVFCWDSVFGDGAGDVFSGRITSG
jgi:hypothetical protein